MEGIRRIDRGEGNRMPHISKIFLPEDILFATEEMIERLDKNNFDDLKPLQKKAKNIIKT